MNRAYLFVAAIFCFNVQAFEQTVSCINQLTVKVIAKEKTRAFSFFETFSFHNNETIVSGRLEIINTSETSKSFSTKMLEARFNDAEASRSFVKGLASYVLDFDTGQEVLPYSTLKVDVVWKPNLTAGIKLQSAEFFCY